MTDAFKTLSVLLVGDQMPPFKFGPITRGMIAAYAAASGDDNPHTLDPGAARAAGFDDVIAHGMLAMACLGRALTSWAAPCVIVEWGVRFVAATLPDDVLVCSATVTERTACTHGLQLQLEIDATSIRGVTTLHGSATLCIRGG